MAVSGTAFQIRRKAAFLYPQERRKILNIHIRSPTRQGIPGTGRRTQKRSDNENMEKGETRITAEQAVRKYDLLFF